MTETNEFYAESVEEAVEKAATKLGLSKEELAYTVLDSGSSGFLGMGSRDARIAVEGGDASEDDVDEIGTSNGEEGSPADDSTELPPTPAPATEDDVSGERPPGEQPEVTEDLLREIQEFVDRTLDTIGLDARVDVYDAEDFVAVDVATEEAGLFIGQKGETIDAFQYLLNVAVYSERPYAKRIIVDSEGYRQRRVEAVQGIAHRMARKAVREAQVIELPPMNTSERRIVHMFLKDNSKVRTESQGTGGRRRVTIAPD
jgi:spoIIIJ-associated protein